MLDCLHDQLLKTKYSVKNIKNWIASALSPTPCGKPDAVISFQEWYDGKSHYFIPSMCYSRYTAFEHGVSILGLLCYRLVAVHWEFDEKLCCLCREE